ncbi:MAG: hypothetical protein HY646_07935 [Acidobacteria bacterium]|nr:hypothetical protein [Acidobacteriota bacterium]
MIRVISGIFLLALFTLPAFAKCPLPDGGTLIVRAPVGNLQVETTGRDAVEVLIDNSGIELKETCGPDTAEFTGNTPTQFQGSTVWRIIVPKTVNLDLVAYAGTITMGDSDGSVKLRTTGGSVIAGNIKGSAAIVTQGGFIKAGDIGGNAELRSQGGSLEVGNVGGDAEFYSALRINAGVINGKVNAEAGDRITIKEARGDVRVSTKAGDIAIADALRINARSAGGSISTQRVRGPFQGHTESGDIRLDSAGAWVEASTGFGNIVVTLIPENLDGDLHVDLESGVGDVMLYLPERMKATVRASVERPALSAQRIFSDFPMNPITPAQVKGIAPARFLAPLQSEAILNGGGNLIKLHTSLGKIDLKKR